MGKTRDLFKKIRDTKGTFHAKMGLLKDRNGMDLQPWGLWGQDLSLPGLSTESQLSTHHLCPALHQNTNPPLPQCEVSLLTFPHICHTWAPASYLIFLNGVINSALLACSCY